MKGSSTSNSEVTPAHAPTRSVSPSVPEASFAARLFAVAWAWALVVHHRFDLGELEPLEGVEVVAAMLVMSFPANPSLLVLLAGAQVVSYLSQMPVASNHYTVMMFGNLGILMAAWHAWRHEPQSDRSQALFRQLRRLLPWLLFVLYFWGTFHKLNTAYLNPDVSCGPELMARLEAALGWEPAGFTAWLAIAATFLCEGGALCLLAVRWGWAPAVVLILPFHLAIAATGFAYYVDFTALMLAMFISLFDDARLEPLQRLWLRLTLFLEKLRGARHALPAAITLLAYVGVGLSKSTPRFGPQILIGGVLGCLLYAGLAACAVHALRQRKVWGQRPLGKLSLGPALLVALFFLDGACPYLGFKTESSFAMYSNLRTEGQSNHLLVSEAWQLTGFETPVRIHGTDIQSLRRYRKKDMGVTWFELWRAVKASPKGYVVYEAGGLSEAYDGRRGEALAYEPPWLLEKLLRFKPVRFRTPNPCTH